MVVAARTQARAVCLRPFAGEALSPPPIWLMRQAGRYLPEYRAVRAKAGGFLDLCYTPELAAEVTLQPIRRFGFDAAILFADILLVPDALGQQVALRRGRGAAARPRAQRADLPRLSRDATWPKFALVCETVARLRQDLPHETALIGFCGAPWTVATYMVEGQGSPDQRAARLWAYRDPAGFGRLIDLLVEASIEYLSGQVQAGADVLQIFDTWAGALSPGSSRRGWWRRPGNRERDLRQASKGAGHRLSAGSGGQDRTVRGGDGRARRGLRHGHGSRADADPRPIDGRGRAGQPRSTCALLPAERRSSDRQSDY